MLEIRHVKRYRKQLTDPTRIRDHMISIEGCTFLNPEKDNTLNMYIIVISVTYNVYPQEKGLGKHLVVRK